MRKLVIPLITLAIASACTEDQSQITVNEHSANPVVVTEAITDYDRFPFEYKEPDDVNQTARVGGRIVSEVPIYAPGSGTAFEQEVKCDPGYVCTGIGIRVNQGNVVRLELEERYLYSDGSLGGRYRLCPECDGSNERWLTVPDGAAIVDIGVRVNQDDCALLQIRYRYINSSARFNSALYSSSTGSGSPELLYKWDYSDYSYSQSAFTGIALRVAQDDFVTLKAWVGKLQ